MKGNRQAPWRRLGGAMWKGRAETFINKGTNGRWKDVLTKAQVEAYDKAAEARLGKDCTTWLALGGGPGKY